MTTPIFPGRYTAQLSQDFVVFLIGMRINNLWAFRKWFPVAQAMPGMVQTLMEHPEKGFLHAENFFSWPTTLMLSYWRSFEDLEHFARNPSDPHLEAWKQFRKVVGDDGSTGIWHETYLVRAGEHEAIYGNMPRFGLAKAFEHLPITHPTKTARQRLAPTQAIPSYPEY